MPLVIFAAFAVLCQVATIVISLAIDRFVAAWISVMAFGLLYILAFAVAWKLTVWAVERFMPQVANGSRS